MEGWRWGCSIFPIDEQAGCFSKTLSQRSCLDLQTCLTHECSGGFQASERKQMFQLPFPLIAAAHYHHHALALTPGCVSTLTVTRERREPSTLCCNRALTGDSLAPGSCSRCVLPLPGVTLLPILPLLKPWNHTCHNPFPSKGKTNSINWMEGENVEDYPCTQGAILTLASWRWEGQWPRGTGRSNT